ncbi:hypothetical protein L6452_18653 [Arctium lappa]|uniref:Uncharacterized protein n=1 Tax=Arctium lappa TaxID=4217 RepID=A0ACB9C708_ARCLA|nr:hypothetical protein L6452_18653 [Arctium lappa]
MSATSQSMSASQGGYTVDYANPTTQGGFPGSYLNQNSQAGYSRFGTRNDFMSQVNDPPVRNSQECVIRTRLVKITCEVDVLFHNQYVQAADSLLKLVSELKQTAIFSGFTSLNDHVEKRSEELNLQAEKTG